MRERGVNRHTGSAGWDQSDADAGSATSVFGARARLPTSGTVLAFDYGERRIGVAVGELELGIAHPLETIHAVGKAQRAAAIAALVRAWGPVLLVVGLPLHADGSEHRLSQRCRRFASALQCRFGTSTVLVDERYTSLTARQALAEQGVQGRRQKAAVDRVAAQHILEAYFAGRSIAA